jgi:type II secretory pathway component PulC
MYESFDYIKEGIIYGKIKNIMKDKVIIEISGKEYTFDKPVDINKLNPGDYVRFYMKNNNIVYIEKISQNLYENIKKILESLNE